MQTGSAEQTVLGVSGTYNLDVDLGDENNDFDLALDYSEWAKYNLSEDDYLSNESMAVYVPGEEYGGYVTEIEGATNTEKIHLRGYTWRGMLAKRVIKPPSGADYLVMSGRLEDIVRTLITDMGVTNFVVYGDEDTPTVTNYQFDRYVTLLEGIEKLLASKGYRLQISYDQARSVYTHYSAGEDVHRVINSDTIKLRCVPALDYGSEIEISQDAKMDFVSKDYRRGLNHLICLGTGELRDRIVVDLYADENGNIVRQQPAGIGRLYEEVFDDPGADEDGLVKYGTDTLLQKINSKSFTAKAKYIDNINLGIGDTITGRDLITGTVVTKPIKQKIVKISDGIATVNYVL